MGRQKKQQKEQSNSASKEDQINKKIYKSNKKKDVAQTPSKLVPSDKENSQQKSKIQLRKASQKKINSKFYPEQKSLNFPDYLEQNLLRVIASSRNTAKKQDIQDNLPRFYIGELNDDDFVVLYKELARLEEEGVILENNGIYSVTEAHLPAEQDFHDFFRSSIRQNMNSSILDENKESQIVTLYQRADHQLIEEQN